MPNGVTASEAWRMILKLLIGASILGGLAWGNDMTEKNNTQDLHINTLETNYQNIEKGLDRIDKKLDKLSERRTK